MLSLNLASAIGGNSHSFFALYGLSIMAVPVSMPAVIVEKAWGLLYNLDNVSMDARGCMRRNSAVNT